MPVSSSKQSHQESPKMTFPLPPAIRSLLTSLPLRCLAIWLLKADAVAHLEAAHLQRAGAAWWTLV